MGEMTWLQRLDRARTREGDPYLGHALLPIPLRDNRARTERASTYVELDLLKFYEQYCARGGFKSVSEVIRRLTIVGAMAEGYKFDGDVQVGKEPAQ